MSYKPTKSDIATALGATLADALESGDAIPGEIDVLTTAFIRATIAAAKPADRPVLREVTSHPTGRNAWLAKAASMCKRQWKTIQTIAPCRVAAITEAATA